MQPKLHNLFRTKAVWAIIIFLLIINLNAVIPSREYVINPPRVDIQDPDAVREFVRETAIKRGADPRVALFILEHESQADEDVITGAVIGDSHLICNLPKSPNYGKKMRSRGGWQISDCSHYEVSDKIAFDIVASTELVMDWIKTNPNQWSTWRFRKQWYHFYEI